MEAPLKDIESTGGLRILVVVCISDVHNNDSTKEKGIRNNYEKIRNIYEKRCTMYRPCSFTHSMLVKARFDAYKQGK